jgi:hypothetical protein
LTSSTFIFVAIVTSFFNPRRIGRCLRRFRGWQRCVCRRIQRAISYHSTAVIVNRISSHYYRGMSTPTPPPIRCFLISAGVQWVECGARPPPRPRPWAAAPWVSFSGRLLNPNMRGMRGASAPAPPAMSCRPLEPCSHDVCSCSALLVMPLSVKKRFAHKAEIGMTTDPLAGNRT